MKYFKVSKLDQPSYKIQPFRDPISRTFFANRFRLWNNLKYFNVSKLKQRALKITLFANSFRQSYNLEFFKVSYLELIAEKSHFFRKPFSSLKRLKEFNFSKLEYLAKNSTLFANRFRVWENSNYLRTRAWLVCLKKSSFSQNDSVYQVNWKRSKFQSLNSHLADFKLLWTNSFYEKTRYISKFQNFKIFQNFVAPIDCWKISAFLQTVFIFEEIWKNSNFQSSNSWLKYSTFSAHRFRVWGNLHYLRSRAWLACMKKSTLLRTDSFFGKTCFISKFQSSNS